MPPCKYLTVHVLIESTEFIGVNLLSPSKRCGQLLPTWVACRGAASAAVVACRRDRADEAAVVAPCVK